MNTDKHILSPYQIHWAIITPLNGIVVKKDRQTFKNTWGKKQSFFHSYGKEAVIKKAKEFNGKLTKAYEVVIITDMQFGRVKDFDFKSTYTAKQISERFTIQ